MKYSIKTVIAVTMLFAATVSANAQFDNNRETKRFHMGLHGGMSVNSYNGDASDYYDQFLYFTGGLHFDFQVAPVPVYLGFELNYVNLGAKYYYYGHDYYSYNSHRSYDNTIDINCLNIPIYFGYHFNLTPNFFISPHAGISMSYCLDDLDDDNYDWDDDRFNYALRLGLGLNFGRLTFDLSYDLGLKNLGDRDYKSHTGTFFATIGVNLAGSR